MKRLALCVLMVIAIASFTVSCDDSSDGSGTEYYLTYSLITSGTIQMANDTLKAGPNDVNFTGIPAATLESYSAEITDALRCAAFKEAFSYSDIGSSTAIDYAYFEIPGTNSGTYTSTNISNYPCLFVIGGAEYSATGNSFTLTVTDNGSTSQGTVKGNFSMEVKNTTDDVYTLEATFCLKRVVDEAINI